MTLVHDDRVSNSISRVRQLVAQIKGRFWGNARCAELMAACAVAGEPLLMLGEPGTAKTSMALTFFDLLGLQRGEPNGYFEKCLHPFVEPSEVWGPLDFNALTGQGGAVSRYRRITAGFLAEARATFLDEIFAASPDFLLTLLSILEERVFHNGADVVRSPLAIILTASNDLPQDDRLRALRDRLPLRVVTDSPVKADDRAETLERSYARWHARGGVHGAPTAARDGQAVCTFDDIQRCGQAILVKKEKGDVSQDAFVRRYVDCVGALVLDPRDLVSLGPRAQQKIYQVMRALALLRRENPEPQVEELTVLEHVFKNTEAGVRTALHDHLKMFADWIEMPPQ